MPDRPEDWEYEFVYYYPDLDEVKCVIKHKKEEFLPNTVDLRKFFDKVDIPKIKCSGNVQDDHGRELEYAVSILKSMIGELFSNNKISNWNDLGVHLNTIPDYYSAPRFYITENGQPKVLNHKKIVNNYDTHTNDVSV